MSPWSDQIIIMVSTQTISITLYIHVYEILQNFCNRGHFSQEQRISAERLKGKIIKYHLLNIYSNFTTIARNNIKVAITLLHVCRAIINVSNNFNVPS